MKVLVTEPLDGVGLACLQDDCQVDVRLKLDEAELLAAIPEYDALIVRSATQVTAQVLTAGDRLKVVGRAGTGVDNIDLEAATRQGVVVVNAPTSNTVAVAEHTMAMMLCLARHIPLANSLAHAGRWEKKGLMGTELRDKTLGLVGLGRVGTAVAHRARAFEMRLLAYDPFVSPERAAQMDVELVDLNTLLAQADYVSLHSPCTERTRGMIGAPQLALIKPGAYLINCARGGLIDEEALAAALTSGTLAGAALDVYVDEPSIPQAFQDCPNVILTPHLGASTREAQSEAAAEVVREVMAVLNGQAPRYPVNTAALPSEELIFLRPYLDLATRMGHLYAQLAANNLTHIELEYAGEITAHDTGLLTAAILAGILAETGHGHVNMVNARLVAKELGFALATVSSDDSQGFSGLVTLRTRTTRAQRELSGSVIRNQPHILRIDGNWLDFVPEGHFLIDEHLDRPGIVGRMGTVLGDAGVNISFVQLGREAKGGVAVMVLGLDEAVRGELLAQVRALPDIRSAHAVNL
jgi:D-3-phosphoglycerate dehydrogenase